ncbi:peptide ABC transporter substrate-binding protein [Arthrobacter sp. AQ5-06]|nr:peptide ABC transporter substrate-binding protein [Arthrobacter sp. AQ5-06]
MLRWKRLAAVAAATALGLTGCSTAEGDPAARASPTLTLGVLVPATTFAAADSSWANESPYMQAVYDTLLKADPNGKIQPSLATEWSYNADNTVLTMKLRTDVKFSDGTAFNADAAVQNLQRFHAGNSSNKSFLADLKDAKAVDPSTVQITLTQSNPALLTYLTQNAGLQESPSAFAKPDLKTNPVGSGPYTLDASKTVVGTSYTFTKNPDYWDAGSVHYDNVVMNVYPNPTALLNAIKGGQVNAATTANNNDLKEIEGAGFTVNPLELNRAGLLLLDRGGKMNPALADVRVRRAINYAFDTEGLLQTLGQGYGTPTTQVFPKNSVAYDPSLDSAYAYDPAKAKKLLADAGYGSGLTLQMPSGTRLGATTFTLIQQQLKDVGITVTYTDTGNNYIADVLAPKFPVTYIPLQQDSDWQLINFQIAPSATWNPFHYQDPAVDALVAKVRDGSKAESDQAAKDLNKYMVDQAWFAPWYRQQLSFVTDSKTKVIVQQGNAYPYLWNFTPAS